jgi:hypothetical protein
LSQDGVDSARWSGRVELAGVSKAGFSYMIQAVSGIGLVAVDDNDGNYYGLGGVPSIAICRPWPSIHRAHRWPLARP